MNNLKYRNFAKKKIFIKIKIFNKIFFSIVT